MIWDNTKIFFRLYFRPLSSMSSIIDEGSWLYAALAVVAVSLLFQLGVTERIYDNYEMVFAPPQWEQPQSPRGRAQTQPRTPAHASAQTATEQTAAQSGAARAQDEEDFYDEDEEFEPQAVRRPLPLVGDAGWWLVSFAPAGFFTTLLGLAVLYVPLTILLMVLFDHLGSFGVCLRREYGTLLACTLMAWAASHLPFALAGFALASVRAGAQVSLVLWLLSALGFAALMLCALRTVFGATFGKAASVVCLSWVAFVAQGHLFAVVSPYLFSPFILYYAYMYFRGDLGDINFSFRQRQNFWRHLESATVNPRDAEAHYQLGLVYQQRRQSAEAVKSFTRAVEIDPQETDARFQLGRIAREQGRLPEAIEHFGHVVAADERHAHHEIWREIGATYLAARMHADARDALERFVERRAFDPEGLYYLGLVYTKLDQQALAQEMFRRCIEAVKTMPYYRRGQLRRWRKLAQDQLSAIPRDSSLATT